MQGAGKTQVIAPLLSLMLADGKSLVTVVCPNSLLQQSRTQFRNRFSNVLQKNIVTLKFERASSEFNTVSGLKKLYQKLVLARKQRAVVLTNPQSIKSLMLKYIDLLLQLRKIPSNLRVLTKGSYTGTLDIASATALLGDSISPFEAASKMADVLGMLTCLVIFFSFYLFRMPRHRYDSEIMELGGKGHRTVRRSRFNIASSEIGAEFPHRE